MPFNPLDHAVLAARSRFLQNRLRPQAPEQPPEPPVAAAAPAPAPQQFRHQLRSGLGKTLGAWWQKITGGR